MVAAVAYEVISEFIFEEAVALAATNSLTKGVENLSKKTDDAIFGVARLGAAYAKNFLTGGGGFLGFLAAATNSSEKFRSTQIELSNTMLANQFKNAEGGVLSFNQAMETSDAILKNISKEAKKANLTTAQLAGSTKLFANFLAPKGAAGDNLSNAVELARVSVKAGAALNIDQTNIQQQIANAIGGNLSKGTLFGSRLFAESGDVLKGQGAGSVKEFNSLTVEKRVKALTLALDKLAGGTDIINARSRSLTQRMVRIKDAMLGMDSILKPLGNTLVNLIGPALDFISKKIETLGPIMVTLANNIFKKIGESPKQLFLNVRQFSALHGDIKQAGNSLRFLATSITILGAVAMIGPLNKFFLSIVRGGGMIGGATKIMLKFSRVVQGALGGTLLKRILSIVPAMGGLIAVFQIFSRAADKLKVTFFETLSERSQAFLKVAVKLQNALFLLFQPLNYIIEIFSDLLGRSMLIGPAFDIVFSAFSLLKDAVTFIAVIVNSLLVVIKMLGAGLGALFGRLFSIAKNPSQILTGDTNIGSSIFEAMNNEMNKGVKGIVDSLTADESGEKTVAKNIHKNTFNNQFNIKEKIEPDRIAFTLQDQLNKLAENRRSSVGSPLIATGGR